MRRAAEAARVAMADTQTAAVIGTTDSQGARASIPLLNAAGFLHVSLGAGYPGFTRPLRGRASPSAGSRPAPGTSRASSATTARRRPRSCAPPGRAASWSRPRAARTAPRWRPRSGARRPAAGVKVVSEPGRDGAVIYAGEDPLAAAEVAESVARETPGARVVLPDAAVRNGVEERLKGAAARRTVLVSSAPEPGSTPALREFEAAFERAYGRRPGPYAALGHAAMETVLDALDAAAADDAAGRASPGAARVLLRRPARDRRGTAGRAAVGCGRDAALHRVPFDRG